MKILTVKQNKKNNPNIFLVTTDDEKAFLLHSDELLKYSIYSNNIIDDKKFFTALTESEIKIATSQAVKYLNQSLKTQKQLTTYLYKKHYPKSTISKVIEKLKEYNIINDEYYAKTYVAYKSNTKSKAYIKNSLKKDGISQDFIEKNLENLDDFEVAQKDAAKFFKSKEVNQKNIEKLIRHLQYKGFGWDTISKVLKLYPNKISLD